MGKMITTLAFDIETIPNPDLISQLPEIPRPTVKYLKKDTDEDRAAKDAEAEEKHKAAVADQIQDMALNPFTSRICAFGVYGCKDAVGDVKESWFINKISDSEEKKAVAILMNYIDATSNGAGVIITFNGLAFDFPTIYGRAMKLGVKCRNVLARFSKRYVTSPHCDLRMVLGSWNPAAKGTLDFYGKHIVGEHKEEPDYRLFGDMIRAGRGQEIADNCLQHTELTYRLFEAIRPYYIGAQQPRRFVDNVY